MRHRLGKDESSLLAASSIIVIFGAATLIATHFSADIAAYVTRDADHKDINITEQESWLANKGLRKSNLVAQRRVESDQVSAPAEAQQAQVEQVAAVSVPEAAQRSLIEDRTEGWAQDPAEVRPAIGGLDVQLRAEAAKSARSLDEVQEKATTLAEESDRSAALASAPATGQSNVEPQVVQSNKSPNEAAELKPAASVAFTEMQRERERAESLASGLTKSRREAEAAAAVSSQKSDGAVQQKQAAEAPIAELRQSPRQERKKGATLMRGAKATHAMTASAAPRRRALEEAQTRAAISELAGTRREIETRAAQSKNAFDAATKQNHTGVAPEAAKQTLAKRGKNSRLAAKKPDAEARPKAEANAKPAAKPIAKPLAVRHANAKLEAAAKPAASAGKTAAAEAKSVSTGEKPAAKPAKPKTVAKPKGETKPSG